MILERDETVVLYKMGMEKGEKDRQKKCLHFEKSYAIIISTFIRRGGLLRRFTRNENEVNEQ